MTHNPKIGTMPACSRKWEEEMERRMFLVRSGQTLVCGLAARATESSLQSNQRQSQDSADTVEQRVVTVIKDL